MQAHAATKLIISGEHAILYGAPALTLQLPLMTQCQLEFQSDLSSGFEINLCDLSVQQTFTWAQWQTQSTQIQQRFDEFKHAHVPIQSVLRTPFDLILIALYKLHQQHPLTKGFWRLHLHSDAPIGRGLGSSASVISALLKACLAQMQISVSTDALWQLVTQIECFQHGRSSGLDPAAILLAPVLKMTPPQQFTSLQLHPITGIQTWLIDTGTPQSSTGECVAQVKQQHGNDSALWQAFTQTCTQIEQALKQGNNLLLLSAIRHNQTLLQQIGVVPSKIADFCATINQNPEQAIKVCGAGAIRGDQAGMLLYLGKQPPTELVSNYGFDCQLIATPFSDTSLL